MKEHLETESKDKFEIMFRSSVIQIEDILEKNLGNTRESMQKRQMWEEDVGALLNEYQIEVWSLQQKFMKQLAVVYKKNLPNIAEVNEILHVDEKED